MPRRRAKFDKRLLGTWQSDRRRTLRDWIWPANLSAAKLKRAGNIFGHLTIRYTREYAHTEFRGVRESTQYQLIAADSSSVAVTSFSTLLGEKRIQHIHFENGCYWVSVGRNREWFKRIK